MVAEHEIPLIVSAWQMGVRGFDGEKLLLLLKRCRLPRVRKVCGGYAGNRDLMPYLKTPVCSGRPRTFF